MADALGEEAKLSRSTVSRVCQAIKDEFDVWRKKRSVKDRARIPLCRRVALPLPSGRPGRAGAVCLGITTEGPPVFLAVASVSGESHDAVVEFLRDLTKRGLRAPLLVVIDGAPGLISAIEQVFDRTLRQRCLVHRARNVIAKVSQGDQDEVKADFWSIFDDIETDPAMAPSTRRTGARKPSPASGSAPIRARWRA